MSVNGARPGVRERLTRWDTHLTCLDEKQKECFIELSSTAANRPLPEHVSSVFSSEIPFCVVTGIFFYSCPWRIKCLVVVQSLFPFNSTAYRTLSR